MLFEALKSRGFNFEETRLREAERLETLCGVLAIAFCWAYHVGVWRHRSKPIALKACPRLERGTHQRAAKSLFRHGFDGIRQAVFNAVDKWEQFEQVLNLLWKVLTSPKAILQPLCPAEESREERVDEVFCIDGQYILVGGIPAAICARCGEQAFSREAVEKIRSMVHSEAKAAKSVSMQVFDFVS